MRFIYCIYQLFICLPLFLLMTIYTALATTIGCTLGNGDYWSYIPPRRWSRFICKILFLPVKVEGMEKLDPKQSYVFVSNHQGIFDIWLIYGYLGRNFKWMMKKELEKIPLVGMACKKANHIYVDRGNTAKMKQTYDFARKILSSGMSLCVFPEGTRTKTGKMGVFKRGAFVLAEDIKLPIVPLTINGSFKVLPSTKGITFVRRHQLTLTIHEPIPYDETKTLKEMMDESSRVIESDVCAEQ
ncbi:MAG: lysophospholipid acyltransferase family protein [Prevotellaceae bacterium]|nr:lysophospholipid acyltransferase family protein [Prevotellaceae bacterium]